MISFSYSAEVKPFYFENVENDSALQQNEFDYMLKYKLFGKEYIKIGNDVEIPDKSGWNGTSGNFTTGPRLVLGGPVLVKGDIVLSDQQQLVTGPIRGNSFAMGNDNNSILAGVMCLNSSEVNQNIKTIVDRSGGVIANSSEDVCSEIPQAPINLTIPTIVFPDTANGNIVFNGNNDEIRIIVPDGEYEDAYDVYLNGIEYNMNNQKLIIQMQEGGRLTRIFVKNFKYYDHGGIQVEYRSEEGNRLLSPKEYRGNVLIYTNNDISITNSDNTIMEGTIISSGKIYLACNINLAGQLLANKLEIGNTYHGENFIFMPFDKQIIDIDPELNKNGGLKENDSTVTIPIKLSDTASVDVYFSYCFELNTNVTIEDFNIEGLAFPICDKDEPKQVIIKSGNTYPNDTIKVNVKIDDKIEQNDTLVVRIKIESGAVLPGDKTEGVLKIKISDADEYRIDKDAKYSIDENVSNVEVGTIKTIGKNENTKFYLVDTTDYSIDSISGVLTIKTPLDYEKTKKDTVWLVMTDGVLKDSSYVVIDVNDVNEAPIVKDTTLKVTENNKVGYVIGTIKIDDEDLATKFRDNIVIQKDKNEFIKVDSTGKVIALKSLDYETQNEIVLDVIVKDRNIGSLSKELKLTINVVNENEPIVTTKNINSIEENSEIGTIVGSVIGKDGDSTKVTYSISGKEFVIDSNGVIKSNMVFDYESKSNYQVVVTSKSTDGSIKNDTLNIKVTNVNEPVHVNDSTFSVKENYVGEIGKVNAWDEDNDNIYYTLSDTTKYKVEDGKIFVKVPFDYETTKEDTLWVYVEDGNNMKDSAKVVVNITNVNESPIVEELKTNVDENYIGVIDTMKPSDPDGDKLTYTTDNPNVKIDSNGVVSIIKPFDYEKEKQVVVNVFVDDGHGEIVDTKLVIDVNNVNEPVHVNDGKFDVEENYIGEIGKVEAKDDDGDKITYWVSDSTRYSIDSNGIVSIKIPFDYETTKSDSIKVYVTDGNGELDSAIVKIKVGDVKEKSNIDIIHADTKDSIYTDEGLKNPILTNDKEIKVTYKTDYSKIPLDTIFTLKDGCNDYEIYTNDPTKNYQDTAKINVCYSDKEPIITIATIGTNENSIDRHTIVQNNDGKNYVNSDTSKIRVIVEDPINSKKDTLEVKVDLKPVEVKAKDLTNLHIEPDLVLDESKGDVVVKEIEGNKLEVKQEMTINIDGKPTKVVMTYVADNSGHYLEDTNYKVEYTKVIDGKEVTISYETNGVAQDVKSYTISHKVNDETEIYYSVDSEGHIKKDKENNVGYNIKYTYTNNYGNTGTSEIFVVLDVNPPVVEILTPTYSEKFKTNSVEVVWTVDGVIQDTLNLERLLNDGHNFIERKYIDKAGNVGVAKIVVMKEKNKDLDIDLVRPVTRIDQDKVDEYYANGNKYNPKKPFEVKFVDPNSDEVPEAVGVGMKITLALPNVNSNGGLPTIDDMVENGKGIPVDNNGNLVESCNGVGCTFIDPEEYINDHCTEDFKKEVKSKGMDKVSIWDVKYDMHLWIYNTTSSYVNDYKVSYDLNDTKFVDDAGVLRFILDLIPAKDGHLKSANNKNLATGAYITKFEVVNTNTARCANYQKINGQNTNKKEKGEKVKKKEYDLKTFGYKRPITE